MKRVFTGFNRKNFFFLLMLFLIQQACIITSAQDFFGGEANWTMEQIKPKGDTWLYKTDSLIFRMFTPTRISLLIYYSKEQFSGKAITITNGKFHGTGSYAFSSQGDAVGTYTGTQGIGKYIVASGGLLTISKYDSSLGVVEGDFSYDCWPSDVQQEPKYLIKGNFKIRMKGWKFALKDKHGDSIPNLDFKISKVLDKNPLNNKLIGTYTTNGNGIITVDSLLLDSNDRVIFERLVDSVTSSKDNHEGVDNIKYYIALDNAKINETGAMVFDTLKQFDSIYTIKLVHSTFMYNLVISVEWDAKLEYLNKLASWLKNTSSYLYDVSDGQFMLYKIAIYDTKDHWNNADLQIFASNIQWPCADLSGIDKNSTAVQKAHIYFPRMFFGSNPSNVINTAKPLWMDANPINNYRTYGHEFGHYAFGFGDEYINSSNAPIHTGVLAGHTFGFMDSQYPGSGDYSSEMSSKESYNMNDPAYTVTSQFETNGASCWDYFKNKMEKKYSAGSDAIFCPVFIPKLRDIPAGQNFIPGPNEDINNPDWDIVMKMTVNVTNNSTSASGDFLLTIPDYSDPIYRTEFYKPELTLMKPGLQISQGLAQIDSYDNPPTGFDRSAIILGASVNDTVRFESSVYLIDSSTKSLVNMIPYNGSINVNAVVWNDKIAHEEIQLNRDNAKLQTVDTSFRFINIWNFKNENLFELKHFTTAKYSIPPFMDIDKADNTLARYYLNYDSNTNLWRMDTEDPLNSAGKNWFNFYYTPDSTFFSSQKVIISEIKNDVFAYEGRAYITFDPNNKNLEKVAVFSTQYPPVRNGIKPQFKNPSDVYSVAVFPNISKFDTSTVNYLSILYFNSILSKEEEETLKMFKWDESTKLWENINGIVDTNKKFVTSRITGPGVYTLFTTEKITGTGYEMNHGSDFFEIFPNPAEKYVRFEFSNNLTEPFELTVYNSIGEIVVQFLNSDVIKQKNGFVLNTENLSSGIYYCRYRSGERTESKMLIVIK